MTDNVLAQALVPNVFVKRVHPVFYANEVSSSQIEFHRNFLRIFEVHQAINAKHCPLNCQAGGICVFVGSTAQCHCSQGRTGRLCETRTLIFVYP